MLSFIAFPDQTEQGDAWRPHHAHLIGQDDRTIPGTISFEGGVIRCHTPSPEAAALVVQYPCAGSGVLTLPTTLLPAREEPYLLELELARQRVMLLYGKLEDWWLCLWPDDNPMMKAIEAVRAQFTKAVIATAGREGDWTREQAAQAREALCEAVRISERLALTHAELQVAARYRGLERREALGRGDEENAQPPTVGCAIEDELTTPALQQAIASSVNFIVSPMRWSDIEPQEGRFDLSLTDRWIEWGVRAGGVKVSGGPVLDFSPRGVPRWLYIWEHDYESIREFAIDHAKRVVGRYRRAVNRWTAISGVNVNAGFSFTIDQMLELTRLSTRLIRKLAPGAPVLVEINHAFGEHPTHNPRSVPPFYYTEMIHEAGIEFDGLAIRFQMGDRETGRSTRDLMMVSHVLDIYSQFARPLHVRFGCPSAPVDQSPIMPPAATRSEDDPPNDEPGGCWRGEWTPERQGEWMGKVATIALAKTMVRSLTWQALCDGRGIEMPFGGLIDADGRPKPALRRLAELKLAIEKRRVPTRAIPELSEGPAPAAPVDAAPGDAGTEGA